MSSDQDIFSSTEPPADKQTTTQDAVPNPVEILVGEGKKYTTVEDLAKAYLNADNFIETLKDENRVLRDQSTKLSSLEEALEKLQASGSSANNDEGEVGDVPKNNLDADQVAKMVGQTLLKLETTKTVEGNLKAADAKLKEVFGDRAKAVYDEVASSPAMKATLMSLAQQSPDEFVKFFVNIKGNNGITQTQSGGVGGGSSVNTVNLGSAFANRVGDPETKDYYNDLRQKDPSKYYSQAVQIQMNNAALKNPDKFFGR